MTNQGSVDLTRGRSCANACGTVEALGQMFAHVADETAPTPQELEKGICSDCAKIRGTLGRIRIGDLAAFRPAPKPKHVREERPAAITQKVVPLSQHVPKSALRRPALGPVPQPLPRPLHKGKPKQLSRPASVGGLKKMRTDGLQKAKRSLEAKLRDPRMNAIESMAERLQVQGQLLEIDRKLNS